MPTRGTRLHASAAATALAAAPDRRPYDPSANMAQGVQVNAPLACRRKLVDVVDRGTTHHAKTNQPARQPSASSASRADPMRRDRWQRFSRRDYQALIGRNTWPGVVERTMRKLLFVLASTVTFAVISPAIAQYPGIGRGDSPPLPPPSDWGAAAAAPHRPRQCSTAATITIYDRDRSHWRNRSKRRWW
jgi:hypothetical protein